MNLSESKSLFWLYTLLSLLLIHHLTGYISVHKLLHALDADIRSLPITHKDYFIFSLKWGLGGTLSLAVLSISFFLPALFNRAQGIQDLIRENMEEAERNFALLQKKKDGEVGWHLSFKLHFYRKPLEIFWTAVLLVYFLFLVLISDLNLQNSLELRGDNITISMKTDEKIEALRVFAFSEFYLVQGKDGTISAVMNQAFESIHRDPRPSL